MKGFSFLNLLLLLLLFTSCGSGSKLGSDISITVRNKSSITALSLSQSKITVSQSEVAVNNSLKVTITLLTNNGTPFISNAVKVTLSKSGGTSEGTLSSVTDLGDGTYEATFTGTGIGTATTLEAKVNDKSLTSVSPTITVVQGNSSVATSTLSLSSTSLVSGTSLTVTLRAKDSAGNSLTKGGLRVAFSYSGGTSTGTFSSVTDNDDGTYSATFTGVVAGSATTIGATIEGASVVSTLPTVAVSVGSYSLSVSSLTVSSSSVSSGSSTNITLTAKDLNGNQLPGGGLTVTFSSSGGTSAGTFGAVVDHLDGTYSATFTGVTAGSATTITATINTFSVTSSLPTVTVSPGSYSLSQSLVTVSSATVVSGSSITATLTVKDSNDNQLSGGGLTVLFAKSGGVSDGTWSGVTDHLNGTYSATFTGTTAGSATSIAATINAGSVVSSLPTVTVSVGPPASIAISGGGNNQSAAAGTLLGTVLAVVVKDANNNVLSGINVDWSVTAGGGSLSLCTATTNASGVSNCSYTLGTTPGANTITATVNSTAITTSFSETGTVGAAAKLLFVQQPLNAASGVAISPSITVKVTDAYDNTVTSYATNIDMAIDTNPSTGTLSGTTSQAPSSGVSTFNDLSINYNGTGYKLIASSGALTTATSTAFNITATSASYDWPFDAGSEASYTIGSNIDFTGGVARLSSSDQTDDDNASSTGYLTGTPVGVSYGTLTDGSSGLLLTNNNGCDPTKTNCSTLDSAWTPQWSSIVSFWKMENNWNDSVGPNNGTATGATFSSSPLQAMKIGAYSGSFNGTSNYVSLGNVSTYDFGTTGNFSIQAWVKSSTLPGASGTRIFSTGMASYSNGFYFGFNASASQFAFGIGGGGTQGNSVYVYTTYSNFHNSDWHHVVLVVNRTGGLATLYVDGTTVPMTIVAGTCGSLSGNNIDISTCTSANATHSTSSIIGAYNNGAASAFWKGKIDDLAIWSVALTEAEVQTIYNRQAPFFGGSFTSRIMNGLNTTSAWTKLSWLTTLPFGKELPSTSENSTSYTSLVGSTGATSDNNLMSGIQGLWHMNEASWSGTPNEVIDSSGNNNHGTSANGATTTSAGILGRGGLFVGSNPYVEFPGLTWTPTEYTISFWILPRSCASPNQTIGAVNSWGAFNMHSDSACDAYAGTDVATRFINTNLSGLFTRHIWNHITFTLNSSGTAVMYKNGVQVATKNGMASSGAWGGFRIGNNIGTYSIDGLIDEVALWNRALHATEVKQLFMRGAARLRFQVRTCDDSACSGETWKGPDGTSGTYFSELNNNSNPFAINGTVNPTPPSMVLANFTAAPSTNQYFQYRTFFEGLYALPTPSFMPELKTVTVDPVHYNSSSPGVYGASGLSYYTLASLAETPGAGGCPSGITYNVSTDKVNWKYWDGAAWSLSAGTPANSNSATVISTNASTFPHAGVAYIKALLNSTGTSKCEIDGLHLSGQN